VLFFKSISKYFCIIDEYQYRPAADRLYRYSLQEMSIPHARTLHQLPQHNGVSAAVSRQAGGHWRGGAVAPLVPHLP